MVGDASSAGGDGSSDDDSTGDASDGGTADGAPGTSTDDSSDTGMTVESCSELISQETCRGMQTDGLPCWWETFTPVSREADVCDVLDPVQLCVALEGDSGGAGCFTTPGCDGEGATAPHYGTLDDGTVLIGDFCGRSVPVGWSICETGFADDEVPECACLCELAGGGETDSTG